MLQEMARLLAVSVTPSQNADEEVDLEKEVYHSLLEREKLGNTGIGKGIAIPHSRFAGTDTALVALITLEEAIDYDSLDEQHVNVAFGLLVPQEANEAHLAILANIAKLMSEEENRLALAKVETDEQAISLIKHWSS